MNHNFKNGDVFTQRKGCRVLVEFSQRGTGLVPLWMSPEEARDLADDIRAKADAAKVYEIAGPQIED